MMAMAFLYQYQNTQYSTLTKVIEWLILLSPFIIFLIFLIRDCLSKKDRNGKNFENILKNGLFKGIPKRKKERKRTQQPEGMINIPSLKNEFGRNSSFTYGYRSSKYVFSNSNDDLHNAINNNSLRQNKEYLFNNDNNSNIPSEGITRRPTIEMEMIRSYTKK